MDRKELTDYIVQIRNATLAMGDPIKALQPSEDPMRAYRSTGDPHR